MAQRAGVVVRAQQSLRWSWRAPAGVAPIAVARVCPALVSPTRRRACRLQSRPHEPQGRVPWHLARRSHGPASSTSSTPRRWPPARAAGSRRSARASRMCRWRSRPRRADHRGLGPRGQRLARATARALSSALSAPRTRRPPRPLRRRRRRAVRRSRRCPSPCDPGARRGHPGTRRCRRARSP
jgi:hypothetical protein